MKFIHLADVHLGHVPDRGCSWSDVRGEEIWETFRRVVTGIRENPVDFLFIAGDLFHRQPLLRELKEVNYLFSTIPDTRVFLMAGNHDYLKKDSFYPAFAWAENVTFFQSREISCERVELAEEVVYVYGHSYHSREIREPLYNRISLADTSEETKKVCSILMAHGGDDKHIPIDFRSLAGAGFDYVALGHVHKPEILYDHKMAYAGSMEPLDRTETGHHGWIEGSYTAGKIRIQFVPGAKRSYQRLLLTVREETTQYDLEDQLKMELSTHGKENLYQVVIRGRRAPEVLFLSERLMELGNVTEVLDESRPAYQLAELEKQYSGTLIGSYIAYFREKEHLTEVEEKALYYGLQALLETANGYQAIGNQKFRKNS